MEVEELLHSFADLFTVKFPSSAVLEAKIQSLVDVSRYVDGRQGLADADAVPLVLSLSSRLLPSTLGDPKLPQEMRAFILYVKLLRNLCAGNSKNQDEFVSSDRLGDFVPVVRFLAQICSTPDQAVAIEALQMVLQLLGNAGGLGESSQGKIWERFFPLALGDVAKVSSRKVQETLSMVIFTCCRGSESRCKELSQSRGGSSIMALMLNGGTGGPSTIASNEWLELLVSWLCLTKPFFPTLFCALGDLGPSPTSSEMAADIDVCSSLEAMTFTKEQASLLDIMNAALSAQEQEKHHESPSSSDDAESLSPSHEKFMPASSAAFLVDIIRCAAKLAASMRLSTLTIPTNSPLADVLGLSLSIIRSLSALDEGRSTAVPALASSGLIPLMLDLLEALGAPDTAKKPKETLNPKLENIGQRDVSSGLGSLRINESVEDVVSPPEIHSDDQPSTSLKEVEDFPKTDVYIGYRRDVLAVIANASFRNFSIQEEVREKGGLLLVLQQCMPDSQNPFLREWGLWAIRNLLEGNSKSQSELADLEVRCAVDDPKLKDVGISVEINPETGRPRLVNATASPSSRSSNAAPEEFM